MELSELDGFTAIEPMPRGGGMTDLYFATDEQGRRVVLRVIKEEHRKERTIRRQFFNGIEVLRNLDHPNIVRIFHHGKIHGDPWMAVEYHVCQDLRERISSLDSDLHTYGYRLVQELAETLTYMHQAGYLHMDLKPENILITENLHPILIDFDLAIQHNNRVIKVKKLSGTGNFLAPETYHEHIIDERAEVFAFGATMYELLCGHKPFVAENSQDYRHKLMDLDAEPVPIDQHRTGIAVGLETVILKCLAKRREERYPSMSLVLRDLDSLV